MLINPRNATTFIPLCRTYRSWPPPPTPGVHLNNSSYYIIYPSGAGVHVDRRCFCARVGQSALCPLFFVPLRCLVRITHTSLPVRYFWLESPFKVLLLPVPRSCRSDSVPPQTQGNHKQAVNRAEGGATLDYILNQHLNVSEFLSHCFILMCSMGGAGVRKNVQ